MVLVLEVPVFFGCFVFVDEVLGGRVDPRVGHVVGL